MLGQLCDFPEAGRRASDEDEDEDKTKAGEVFGQWTFALLMETGEGTFGFQILAFADGEGTGMSGIQGRERERERGRWMGSGK